MEEAYPGVSLVGAPQHGIVAIALLHARQVGDERQPDELAALEPEDADRGLVAVAHRPGGAGDDEGRVGDPGEDPIGEADRRVGEGEESSLSARRPTNR